LNAYLLLDPNPVEIVSHELTSHHSSHAKQIIRRRRAKIYDEESMGLTTKILEVKLGNFGSGVFWFGGSHNRGRGLSGSRCKKSHSLQAHPETLPKTGESRVLHGLEPEAADHRLIPELWQLGGSHRCAMPPSPPLSLIPKP